MRRGITRSPSRRRTRFATALHSGAACASSLEAMSAAPPGGRGALSNPAGRFESRNSEAIDDGWDSLAGPLPPLQTIVRPLAARSIMTYNDSPDLGFDCSINPYQGCEHGCIYCYARPSHAYLNLSPGLDFETRLFYKPDAARLLEAELRKPGYRPAMIALGANTDPYQPIEKKLGITRGILEVLERFGHPVGIVTKGTLVERDLDLLAAMAARNLVAVGITLTTLDAALKRGLEPRAAAPAARLRTMQRLAAAGVPVRVMFSPVIPAVNDAELERVLEAAAAVGAISASYVLLRLPYEVKDLFRQWLQAHLPQRAAHVMSLIRQMRGGRDNDPAFGSRFKGQGEFARLLAQRFRLACRRCGLDRPRPGPELSHFRVPPCAGDQFALAL
ncbi:MAG: PA0069 family radical SAM protein [Gammaproteobacteria bacterium]|nr:PA0069 family radical SAM protein [Gammaproteobacteria bacterium]